MLLTNVAEYAIIIENNKILLVQWYEKRGNAWHFPGGRLEEGEDAGEGLRREIKEELNQEVFVLGPVFTKVFTPKTDPMRYAVYYLCSRASDSPIVLKKDELQNFGWFSLEEVQKLNLWQPFYRGLIETLMEPV